LPFAIVSSVSTPSDGGYARAGWPLISATVTSLGNLQESARAISSRPSRSPDGNRLHPERLVNLLFARRRDDLAAAV
jgi:hypothetical protein